MNYLSLGKPMVNELPIFITEKKQYPYSNKSRHLGDASGQLFQAVKIRPLSQ